MLWIGKCHSRANWVQNKLLAALMKMSFISHYRHSIGVKNVAKAQNWIGYVRFVFVFPWVTKALDFLLCIKLHHTLEYACSKGISMPNTRFQSQCTSMRQMKDQKGVMWGLKLFFSSYNKVVKKLTVYSNCQNCSNVYVVLWWHM